MESIRPTKFFKCLIFAKDYILIKIAFHTAYVHPVKEGHRFPMEKYELIPAQLLHEGLFNEENFFEPAATSIHIVKLAHQSDYVDHLMNQTLSPQMVRRIGFPLSRELVQRELLLTQGTIDGAMYAIQHGIAFNIAGGTHHAGYDFGEGFCLLNDQAIAAAYLIDQQIVQKVLIVDLDVHQGNGTAHIFEGNDHVITFSMHGEKNFPFIKQRSDLDVALPDGITDQPYLSLLRNHLDDLFDLHKPDFVFYQAGVDVLATDKLGKLSLSSEGCYQRDECVLRACRDRRIPIQISMGGGYSPTIRTIVDAHVNTFRIALDLFTF